VTPRARDRTTVCRPITISAFALGIAGLHLLPVLPDTSFSIFLLSAALAALIFRSKHAAWAALCIGLCYASLWSGHALSQRLPLSQSGGAGIATVEIIGLPERDAEQWRFQARILASEGFSALHGRKIKLSWYRAKEAIEPGDIWRFHLLLRTPNGVQNPGGFDSEQRALQDGIAAQGYIKKQAVFLSAQASMDRFRNMLSQRISQSLSADKGRFVQALALGDTRGLTDQDWEILRRTGITHLIAISGFHVGMVAVFAVWCVRGFYWLIPACGIRLTRMHACALASIMASWAYTALAGFAIPTVRTALMISVFMLCRLLHRHISTLQAVCLSLLAILLSDPFSILSPGFWLSFSGVLSLILFMPQTSGQGMLRPFIRAQWVVSLALLPLGIGFFNQSTLIGPLVNLLAIPWISLVVVPIALLGCLFAWLPAFAGVLWHVAACTMQALWRLLLLVQDQYWAGYYSAEPTLLMIALAMLGACVCLLPNVMPGKWLGFFLMLPMLAPEAISIPHAQIRVAMMDVGQGLSVLIRTRRHTLLYDTGAGNDKGFSRGASTIVPALRAVQVSTLDRVVISHADNDHAGGLPAIRAQIPIGVLDASYRMPGAALCRNGKSWTWDGVRFEYLWPAAGVNGSDNDNSCVLRIDAGGRSILLTGDISKNAEQQLLALQGSRLASEIIVVPHHGSKTSSSATFLQAVKPKLALVSSGFQNRFRHPNHQVIQRYHIQGAQVVNSVDSGWAELESGPSGWRWLNRARVEGRRYWHRASPQESLDGY
jgi:competence protein ComEC